MNIKKFVNNILNIIFPQECLICRIIITPDNQLCDECLSKVNFLVDNYCVSCGTILPNDLSLCTKCILTPSPVTILKSVFLYDINSKNMILNLKFYDDTSYIKIYAQWLYNRGDTIFKNVDIILPIPLHRIRLFTRKYNQSALLAHSLSKLSNIPLELFACKRIKNTLLQYNLSISKRKHNLKGSFIILDNDLVKDKTILLVDDVVTTGSTLTTCADTLLNAGAKEIRALTLGRRLLN